MDPNALPLLATVAGGFVLAIACDQFSRKTQFAKDHGMLNTFLGMILVGVAIYISVRVNQIGGSWLLPMFGFFAVAKFNESRDKRARARDLHDKWVAVVDKALGERQGGEPVEIDVTGAPDTVFWYLINTNKKKGFKVETIKDQSSGETKMRLSGGV